MNKLFKTFCKHFGKSDAQSIVNDIASMNSGGGGEQSDALKVEWFEPHIESGSSLVVTISFYDNRYPVGVLKVNTDSSVYYFYISFDANNDTGKISYTATITNSAFRDVFETNKNLQALCINYD